MEAYGIPCSDFATAKLTLTADHIPDHCQLRRWFIGKVLHLPGATIPIPAVVLIPFNLVQDGVKPGGSSIRLVLLHDLMGGIPFTRKRKIDGSKEVLPHSAP